MDILVDTHILLWLFFEPEKISRKTIEYLSNPKNNYYYSTISVWEVVIKHKNGKINCSGTEFMHYCEHGNFVKLPFDDRHVLAVETLSKYPDTPPHNDPFDQALLSQAKADGLMLLTHDQKFKYYDEPNVLLV